MVFFKKIAFGPASLWVGRDPARRCGNPPRECAADRSGATGFSKRPAASPRLLTRKAPTPPQSLRLGKAPKPPSRYTGARTGPSGHRPPQSGSGLHAPRSPRSPPGDGRSPCPQSRIQARPEAAALRQAVAEADWDTVERYGGLNPVLKKITQLAQESPVLNGRGMIDDFRLWGSRRCRRKGGPFTKGG